MAVRSPVAAVCDRRKGYAVTADSAVIDRRYNKNRLASRKKSARRFRLRALVNFFASR